ncbi:MAG: NAD(P)/FAD-dependent oxidoreductase [Bacteroidota bacterium]|nr:NAD(P)/FAD-dependent oxidoreductase [Bacteroidota bacterium]MDX5405228.1 NAD(P)/FAD-dependent oxidoreductase [Bacteroidota bacterium]MDX5427108.1 NAD(P)/FAD-dependent oxidoreductase [Bacteroidota bacterium]MDX5449220.1 NAD(P)/FAD-dependent oxidoreductase [Bacteroidota bacterium]MDX5505075.1 NAD(P)/FAD-dependent oxidoreductase [Bacteroidota bacterium]
MKNLVILGAGTAGTMMSNHLSKALPHDEWHITIVDQKAIHHYQPGYLFIPFGIYEPDEVVKPIKKFLPSSAEYIQKAIEKVIPEKDQVILEDGQVLSYDILIIATGTDIAPEEIDGMVGPHWHRDIFDFYTLDGAVALHDKLKDWEGGELVVHITEMPIKCPVAPLEFAFLADAYFEERGMRDKVKMSFVTPMDGAFTKPVATAKLHHLLSEKKINVVPNFNIMHVDPENRKIVDYEGREVSYDLLVTIPTNKGADYVERSGFGDDLNFVPTDKGTLQSKVKENIFAIGDATNIPASKAGSVAHFEGEILLENILRYIKGEPLKADFDGHANCFVETGHGKALLIDFNYTQQPVPGTFPFPGVGPLTLLKESRMNHMGKLAFKWIYWNMLITGRHIPFVPARMSLSGKELETETV